MIFNKIKSLFLNEANPRKHYKMQSFTFYIPGPPARSSGYREKQFDKLFYEFINRGYKIISLSTQANSGPSGSGMWVICLVEALNSEADSLDFNDVFNTSESEVKIDGLYYIDDQT